MKQVLTIFILFVLSGSLEAQQIKKIKITDLDQTIQRSDHPLIINFWATFCAPCVEEIPYFQEMVAKYKSDNVQLILVSLDLPSFYPDRIRKFANARKFTASIQWLDETDADYFCPVIDSSWSGVLPSTLFVNNKNGYRSFTEEQIKQEMLEAEIRKMLGKIP